MDLAIGLSAVAVVVSIGSALFAKRAADETKELRKIESERRHTERTPMFGTEIEEVSSGQWYRMWLTLEKEESIDSVEVEIIDGNDVYFGDGQTGVDPGVGRTKSARWGQMTIGTKEVAWRVVVGPDAATQMRLRVTSTIGDENWRVLLTVPLPSTYDVAQSVW
ncbi:hypothetical protein GALL_233180 [mine drainage metagenome]|uniref:Uncharacterized protein n=1 Tax=mine drainage metagenome TaxID=410659 RepID=A0A1J5RRE7_9ZZZZ